MKFIIVNMHYLLIYKYTAHWLLLYFYAIVDLLLIWKYEPYRQEVSAESLILMWPLKPVDLSSNSWIKNRDNGRETRGETFGQFNRVDTQESSPTELYKAFSKGESWPTRYLLNSSQLSWRYSTPCRHLSWKPKDYQRMREAWLFISSSFGIRFMEQLYK